MEINNWPIYSEVALNQFIWLQGRNINQLTNPFFYAGADKSLARPTFRCILFDGENISFDASLVIYRLVQK